MPATGTGVRLFSLRSCPLCTLVASCMWAAPLRHSKTAQGTCGALAPHRHNKGRAAICVRRRGLRLVCRHHREAQLAHLHNKRAPVDTQSARWSVTLASCALDCQEPLAVELAAAEVGLWMH